MIPIDHRGRGDTQQADPDSQIGNSNFVRALRVLCGERFLLVYDYSALMKLSEIAAALDLRLENGSPDTEITVC